MSMKTKTNVILVEGCPVYRESISGILECSSDVELISAYSTAETALRSLQDMSTRRVPDLILLDLRLPGMSGLEALPYFKQTIPDIKILLLTQSVDKADVMKAINAGFNGYLHKSASQEKIIENIRLVINGGVSIDSSVTGFLFDSIKKMFPETRQEVKLTKRELEVLSLIAEGMMMKEIATHLGLGTTTIQTHAKHVYEKLEVRNAPAAIHKAYLTGILSHHMEVDHKPKKNGLTIKHRLFHKLQPRKAS